MTALFSITIFVGAALLFLVQPMIGKLVLPRAGGSPEVWNTCMVFFQTALLAGYAYAHVLQRVPRRGLQLGFHALALAAPIFVLPFALPSEWAPPPANLGSPALAILQVLTLTAALPFALVATTGPLLQRWYSLAGARHAHDPYFLYAASNLGSMLGLLAYPILVEPFLTLSQQSRLWAVGYAAYAALVAACGVVMLRTRPSQSGPSPGSAPGAQALADPEPPLAAPSITGRLRWLLLALVPSSLCLGATHYLATDVASVPFLWVLPLAVYLLTFIIAYSRRPLPAQAMSAGLVVAALVAALVQLRVDHPPILGSVLLHLAILFLGGSLCHGELARARPPSARLTEYYFIISVGGAIGGAFNALVAPQIFHTGLAAAVWEYPIAIVAALLLTPPALLRRGPGAAFHGPRLLAATIALLLVASALCATILARDYKGRVIHRERTFFGVHVVARFESTSPDGRLIAYHTLWHGTTNHGVEQMEPRDTRATPLAYFHRQSPIGSIFAVAHDDEFYDKLARQRFAFDGTTLKRPSAARVAIIGMSADTLAAYARPSDQYTFYEIDPAVDRIARDPSLFAFVPEAKGRVNTVIGDGRLRMAEAPDSSFDLIILDAFSSDSIPYHLLTREAFRVYLSKLAPGGIIAVHLSNVHLDLPPVVAAVAADLALPIIRWDYVATPEQNRRAMSSATWVALARTEDDLVALNFGPGTWAPIEPRPGARVWTDDYSNLLGALKAFED